MNGIEVVATTGDPAFAVDLEGRIIAWNVAAEHCLGYQRSEILGRCCWKVLQGQDLTSNRYCDKSCPVRNMAVKHEPIHCTEMFFLNGAGGRTRVSMSTLVVQGERGHEIVHLLRCPCPAVEEPAFPDPETVNSGARLSVRQLEVLKQLSVGLGTQDIAEMLCISPATVRHHIQNILSRLKVHSRLEAVALARRIGLV